MAMTDALAKTIEDTKSFVDQATEKMNTASQLLNEDVALVSQALKDYQEVKDMVEEVKAHLSSAVDPLREGVHAASDGNLLTLAATAATGRAEIVDATTRHSYAFTNLQQNLANSYDADAHNAHTTSAR